MGIFFSLDIINSPSTDKDTQSCPRSPEYQLILEDVCDSVSKYDNDPVL